MVLQGHFTAPAKPLREERRTPNGDLTDSFVPSDGRAVPRRALGRHDWWSALGKVVDMQTNEPRQRSRVRRMLAGLLGALRGDKYMANAYPPAWRSPADIDAAAGTEER
jgi:hypothetical protein